MKIALIGYGKMGHIIERIARERGHEIVSIIDINNQADFESPAFKSADVAIEFTVPATAVDNYRKAFEQGVPVVSGTTGWTERMPEVQEMCRKADGTFFWASNFSLGVNIFFRVNAYLAKLMAPFSQYTPHLTEIHHIHKLDHPSGTAITLAEGVLENNPAYKRWSETDTANDVLSVEAIREGEVPGTHIVSWQSAVDSITIEHKANSREGFALGAVVAAEWLKGKRGVHTMEQLLDELIASSSSSSH